MRSFVSTSQKKKFNAFTLVNHWEMMVHCMCSIDTEQHYTLYILINCNGANCAGASIHQSVVMVLRTWSTS